MKFFRSISRYNFLLLALFSLIHGMEDKRKTYKEISLGTRLLHHIQHGDIRGIKKALNDGANINYQDCETGDTAFHYMVRYHQFLLFPLIDIKGANKCIKNNKNITPGRELLCQPIQTRYELRWEIFDKLESTG